MWLHSLVGRASHRHSQRSRIQIPLKPWFFQASSFELPKLEIYWWSFFTFMYNRSSNMNYLIYTSHQRDTMRTFFTIASIIHSWITQRRLSRQLLITIAGVTSTDSWPFTRHLFRHGSVNRANQGGDGLKMASSFGGEEFAMFAAIVWSPFQNTIIDPAVTLTFMSELYES